MIYQINEDGIYIEVYPFNDIPLIEIEEELIADPSFVSTLIPNYIYMERGVSPKWTGSDWVATSEPPEQKPQPPSDIEKLEAKINAANEYTDFLEEVIVEMAQAVYG